jgi:hypothetical protein
LARQITAPGEAEAAEDAAAETLETVVVHAPVGGGGETTFLIVQLYVAGDASALPAASVAFTEN